MRNVKWMVLLLGVLVICGCKTIRQTERRAGRKTVSKERAAPFQRTDGMFLFVIQSNPSEADVYLKQRSGKEKLLGTTPLTLPLQLVRAKKQGPLKFFGKGPWVARLPADSPFVVDSSETYLNVRIPELILKKTGYEQETFSKSWQFPADLKERISKWKTAPIDRGYRETVVFRNPTKASSKTTVTIDCATGPATIHAIDASGNPGRLIGTTPHTYEIGYSPMYNAVGRIESWKCWVIKDSELWKVMANGNLVLNAIFMRDGYAPEKVSRVICNFKDQPPEELTALFQMLLPTQPEASFKLHLNSLPSAASVFVLNADGSVGGEFGKTPLEITIGIAQESAEESPGRYVHKDWRLWVPTGLVRWDVQRNGGLVLNLTCAIYKDGFAVENLVHPIFHLTPGMAYPGDLTLTVPLPSAEQAAVRESYQLQQTRILATEEAAQNRRRSNVVWQAPPLAERVDDEQAPRSTAEPATEDAPRRSWWNRIWRSDQ